MILMFDFFFHQQEGTMPTMLTEESVEVVPSQWEEGIPDAVSRMSREGGKLKRVILFFEVPKPQPQGEGDAHES